MSARTRTLWSGARAAVPFVVGGFIFGVLFGAVARDSGLDLAQTFAMSALLNGGTAQMIAVGLFLAQAPVLVVVAICAAVNLRHVFYSAALSAHVRRLSLPWRLALGFLLIDQVFAMAMKRYEEDDRDDGDQHVFVLGVALSMYFGWLVATVLGWFAGAFVDRLHALGFDFVITAIYIGLVMSALTSRRSVLAGVVGGVLALALAWMPYQLGMFAAILFVLLAFAIWEGRIRRRAALDST